MTNDWKDDLLIESLHPPNKGGQHVGMQNYPIKVTHIPSGIVAICGKERSQHKNKNIAISMIEYGLLELKEI